MVVYLDLVFLTNFVIDGATLTTAAWTRKLRIKTWRIAAAAFVGGLYVLFMFYPALSILFTLAVKCLISLLMIFIAFGYGNLQTFLRNTGTFYVVNFVAAGGIFAFNYIRQDSNEIMNGILFTQSGGLGFPVSIGLLLVGVIFIFTILLYKGVFAGAKQRDILVQHIADVHVHIDGRESICRGLIDTGNQLYDPLTRTPVMVMEASLWSDVLPPSWMEGLKRGEAHKIVAEFDFEKESFIWQDRLRLVPYRGINKGAQFMLALKPDKVVIVHNGATYEAVKVLIGLDAGMLCSDRSYQAIIHPMLIHQ